MENTLSVGEALVYLLLALTCSSVLQACVFSTIYRREKKRQLTTEEIFERSMDPISVIQLRAPSESVRTLH